MRNFRRSRIGLFLAVALVAALSVVPAASAQDANDPSSAQYDAPIPDSGTAGASASGGGGDPGGGNIGSLPFTGMDLLIIGGVAFVLTGTGFALRRLSTPRGPSV
jgi:hypothetical protein